MLESNNNTTLTPTQDGEIVEDNSNQKLRVYQTGPSSASARTQADVLHAQFRDAGSVIRFGLNVSANCLIWPELWLILSLESPL